METVKNDIEASSVVCPGYLLKGVLYTEDDEVQSDLRCGCDVKGCVWGGSRKRNKQVFSSMGQKEDELNRRYDVQSRIPMKPSPTSLHANVTRLPYSWITCRNHQGIILAKVAELKKKKQLAKETDEKELNWLLTDVYKQLAIYASNSNDLKNNYLLCQRI
ncbi:hypothetical protein Tco_1177885 [Tanacetum coccineum]